MLDDSAKDLHLGLTPEQREHIIELLDEYGVTLYHRNNPKAAPAGGFEPCACCFFFSHLDWIYQITSDMKTPGIVVLNVTEALNACDYYITILHEIGHIRRLVHIKDMDRLLAKVGQRPTGVVNKPWLAHKEERMAWKFAYQNYRGKISEQTLKNSNAALASYRKTGIKR